MTRIFFLLAFIMASLPSSIHAQDDTILCFDAAVQQGWVIGSGDPPYVDTPIQTFLTDNNEWTVTQIAFNTIKYADGADTDVRIALHETIYVTGQGWGAGWVPVEAVIAEVTFSTSILPDYDPPLTWVDFNCAALVLDPHEDLMLDVPVVLQPNTNYAISYRKDQEDFDDDIYVQWNGISSGLFAYPDGGEFMADDGDFEPPPYYPYPYSYTPLEDDYSFAILGTTSAPEVPVPPLFLFAYVGIAMLGTSILLSMVKASATAIVAMNGLVFLMAIGLGYIPDYILIVVMMIIGIGVLMSRGGGREAQSG